MDIPITQSKEWQKFQDSLGEESFFEQTDSYQFLAIKKHTPVGNYLYLPYGPVLQNVAAMASALDAITAIARAHHAIFIRIEPQLPEATKYLPKSAKKVKDICPADTWRLDLTPDIPTLLTNFSQGTRTRYNTSAKKGITVETTKNPSEIRHLVELQAKLFRAKHLTAYSADYLKKELAEPFATLYLAKYRQSEDLSRAEATNLVQPSKVGKSQKVTEPSPRATTYPVDGQVLAASLFFDHAGTRYYMQSAADQDFRRLPATVALLTRAIFDAKAQGIATFDFWGIAPEGAPDSHPWKGFTAFKQSFGGYPVHYAGTYDIVLSPAGYYLYNLLHRLRK